MNLTKRSAYYYNLPEAQIAQKPLENRAESKLMLLDRKKQDRQHSTFSDIVNFFKKDDILVLNTTKVFPARLFGNKDTGAKVEVFLLNQLNESHWECLVKPGRKLHPGAKIIFSEKLEGEVKDYADEGARIIQFSWEGNFWETLDELGNVPLPPYIQRESDENDKTAYQTVYADEKGSVAAPTAGLHFTKDILNALENKGVTICNVLLHVGLGTFRPVKSDDILGHKMHKEYCEIDPKTALLINNAKENGQRIIAVGTTTTRTLESFAVNGLLSSGSKWTDLFLYPGKKLQIIDGLITNFHMPESTLLMLVSAFAGYNFVMESYQKAVQNKYRFFSYGDAMFIF